jgi:hypothetical protein
VKHQDGVGHTKNGALASGLDMRLHLSARGRVVPQAHVLLDTNKMTFAARWRWQLATDVCIAITRRFGGQNWTLVQHKMPSFPLDHSVHINFAIYNRLQLCIAEQLAKK